jgi:predicted secreted protein
MPGSGGRDILRFKALYSGSATLTLVYGRSWDEAEPPKTFGITVVLQ